MKKQILFFGSVATLAGGSYLGLIRESEFCFPVIIAGIILMLAELFRMNREKVK